MTYFAVQSHAASHKVQYDAPSLLFRAPDGLVSTTNPSKPFQRPCHGPEQLQSSAELQKVNT